MNIKSLYAKYWELETYLKSKQLLAFVSIRCASMPRYEWYCQKLFDLGVGHFISILSSFTLFVLFQWKH